MQVVIALNGGQIIYFELNPSGQLLEVDKKDMGGNVSCLGIAEVPEGRQRAPFVVVGCMDSTVRVLALGPGEALKTKATQTLSATPHSAMLLSAMLSSAGVPHAISSSLLVLSLLNPWCLLITTLHFRFDRNCRHLCATRCLPCSMHGSASRFLLA
jgi:splicing factor 3B subunit 3